MRPIRWLHISDIHMRPRDSWSQDVILKAMCDELVRRRRKGTFVDFILATGDLAFSGKADEYKLMADFFNAISAASGISKERIFCVPGNHDIDRDRQKMSFHGARHILQNQNQIDLFLSPGEELETLLKREENYRQFQNSYFTGQDRARTDEGLGYVSCIVIDDVHLAIVGLDSAWLAEGGLEDHGKLLISERQVINALNMALKSNPDIIIGMAHHPFHLLQEFDRLPVQNRVERTCHFFHCGHLHEPEARKVGHMGAVCLTLAAGASFETRQSHNNYSVVTLDLGQAKRVVESVQYSPTNGAFIFVSTEEYPIEISPSGMLNLGELASAVKTYHASLSPFAHYLSALLLDQKSEVPIPTQNGHTFGSFSILQTQLDGEIKRKTIEFMAFKNIIRVLSKRIPISDILVRYGKSVEQYGIALEELCNLRPEVKSRLSELENDAQMLAVEKLPEASSHAVSLLRQLAAEHDWELLREQAERHLKSPVKSVAIQAKRMLALSLAHSSETDDKTAAIELYRSLVGDVPSEISDASNLAMLLIETGGFDEAKATVLKGIRTFALKQVDHLFEIGQRIVEATGDREFRGKMQAVIADRGTSD